MKPWCWGLASLIACSSPAPRPAAPSPVAPPPAAAPAPAPTPKPAGPPVAKREPFVETLHGVEVRDPYRWMEAGGAGFDAFLDRQAAHAHSVFAAIPGRDQLRDET